MPLALHVEDFTQGEAEAFFAAEWPLHDELLGIRWDARDIVLVARGDEPIGVARGVVVGGVGELKQLLVKKQHARRGVGSLLLLAFEARCRTGGCHKLRLETGDYQARPFYERHGFTVTAALHDDRFHHDWFVMEKRLAAERT